MHITKFNTWVTNGRENIVFKRFVLKLTILRHVLFTSILRARSCGDDLIDKRMRVEKLITTCVVWQCKCKTRARRHAECVIERAGGLSGKNTNESEDRGVPHQRVAAAAARSSRKSAQRYAAVTPTHPRPWLYPRDVRRGCAAGVSANRKFARIHPTSTEPAIWNCALILFAIKMQM